MIKDLSFFFYKASQALMYINDYKSSLGRRNVSYGNSTTNTTVSFVELLLITSLTTNKVPNTKTQFRAFDPNR